MTKSNRQDSKFIDRTHIKSDCNLAQTILSTITLCAARMLIEEQTKLIVNLKGKLLLSLYDKSNLLILCKFHTFAYHTFMSRSCRKHINAIQVRYIFFGNS